MVNEFDFLGKQVLVVGGLSGIGNGIVQVFCIRGVQVVVCGMCVCVVEYFVVEGFDFIGLFYVQFDVGNFGVIDVFKLFFDWFDILVLV